MAKTSPGWIVRTSLQLDAVELDLQRCPAHTSPRCQIRCLPEWDARHAWAPLTRGCRRDLLVEGIHADVSVRSDMPPDPLALRRYGEFGIAWPVPEETVWRILVQQVT
jgi:hypothetical protein